MNTQPSRGRLVAVLWFVAAALAFIAAGIPALKDGAPNWGVAAPGAFCLVMGIAALRRKQEPPTPP
jgi:hypothetical protein